ncbi:MAG: hypothetical protein IJ246_03865 [Clostridia bacterium]|nr:hypothetical protein [Clostridia bacterium]
MFQHSDITRNACMLHGPLAYHGYDWWWHSFTAQDPDTGEDKAFFIEFFLCNPALAEDVPVLGQDPVNRKAGKRPSYLMVKAGTWGHDARQMHRFFAWKDVTVDWGVPYSVRADNCLATETLLQGSVSVTPEEVLAHPEWMCEAGSMAWDLKVDKQLAFNVGYGASKPLRDVEAFAMYWHAEGMKTAYAGTVTLDGKVYTVSPEKSFGYADKNWGRDFTSPWVWLSSSCLTSERTGKLLTNSAFDIGGGRPKIYFVPLDRRLLGVFYYEGQEYDFNFSKLHLGVKTTFSFEDRPDLAVWHVRQDNIHAVMETEVFCRKEDMLLIHYEAPDGTRKHNRLWNGGNGWGTVRLYEKKGSITEPVDVVHATHIGCEYGEYTEP